MLGARVAIATSLALLDAGDFDALMIAGGIASAIGIENPRVARTAEHAPA